MGLKNSAKPTYVNLTHLANLYLPPAPPLRNFLTGYIDENGNQVMKLKEIAKVYSRTSGLFDKRVKSSFWLDIMSLVPR